MLLISQQNMDSLYAIIGYLRAPVQKKSVLSYGADQLYYHRKKLDGLETANGCGKTMPGRKVESHRGYISLG